MSGAIASAPNVNIGRDIHVSEPSGTNVAIAPAWLSATNMPTHARAIFRNEQTDVDHAPPKA